MSSISLAAAGVLLSVTVVVGGCAGEVELADQAAPVAEPAAQAVEVPLSRLTPGVRLIGMKANELRALLGQPSLRRSEQAAQYWRYSFDGCNLDIYVYGEPTADDERVGFIRLRQDEPLGTDTAESFCSSLAAHLRTPLSVAPEGDLPAVESH